MYHTAIPNKILFCNCP